LGVLSNHWRCRLAAKSQSYASNCVCSGAVCYVLRPENVDESRYNSNALMRVIFSVHQIFVTDNEISHANAGRPRLLLISFHSRSFPGHDSQSLVLRRIAGSDSFWHFAHAGVANPSPARPSRFLRSMLQVPRVQSIGSAGQSASPKLKSLQPHSACSSPP